jgi:hypothetical protein
MKALLYCSSIFDGSQRATISIGVARKRFFAAKQGAFPTAHAAGRRGANSSAGLHLKRAVGTGTTADVLWKYAGGVMLDGLEILSRRGDFLPSDWLMFALSCVADSPTALNQSEDLPKGNPQPKEHLTTSSLVRTLGSGSVHRTLPVVLFAALMASQ